MNREIVELREVVTKLVPMLTGKGLKVTQRGAKAFVAADPKTRKPIQINIPNIGDDATPEFCRAIQGFIDHEVGHVLITDWNYYGGGPTAAQLRDPKVQAFQNTHNIVEDTMIEREMVNIFPGSRKNIHDLREHFIAAISEPAIKKAQDEKERFVYLVVPMMRALAGHPEFIEQMDRGGYWSDPRVAHVCKHLKPATLAKLKTCKTTKETLAIARELHDILYPPEPPQPKQEPQKGKSQDKPDQQAGEGNGDGERDHSKSEKKDDASEKDAGSSGDAGDQDDADSEDDAEALESEDKEDAESGDGDADKSDADADSEDGDGEDAADDEDGASSGKGESEEEDADDQDQDAGGEGEDDDGEADDASGRSGGSDEDGDQDDGSSGGDAVEGGNDDDDGGEGSEEDGSPEGAPSAGADPNEDDEQKGLGNEDKETEGGGGVGDGGEAKSLFDYAEDDFEGQDMSGAIAIVLTREAIDAMQGSDYNVYTREADRIEPLETPDNMDPSWVPSMEDATRSMTGKMMKDIERMMAARKNVVRIGGFRSGRLNAPALHRLQTGDDRVFSRRQEHVSKDTAVSLLIDNSGSMNGGIGRGGVAGTKIYTAMLAGFALAQTLERVGIANEVLGFTTGAHNLPATLRDAMHNEIMTSPVHYHRTTPIMIPIYKDFNERVNSTVKKRIAYMANARPGMANNIDGESLEYAAMRLMKRREKRKVLLVLSDGQPAGARNVANHLALVVQKLTAAEIETIGIGIMDSSVKHYYPKSIVLNNLEDLPGQVMGELKQILA